MSDQFSIDQACQPSQFEGLKERPHCARCEALEAHLRASEDLRRAAAHVINAVNVNLNKSPQEFTAPYLPLFHLSEALDRYNQVVPLEAKP